KHAGADERKSDRAYIVSIRQAKAVAVAAGQYLGFVSRAAFPTWPDRVDHKFRRKIEARRYTRVSRRTPDARRDFRQFLTRFIKPRSDCIRYRSVNTAASK